jgi:PPOX class probable F420-dependent enzyme
MTTGSERSGGPLQGERLERFLGGRCLARIAVLRADGSPQVVPVWYHWDGEALWFVGRRHSSWCQNLQTDPRMAAVIDIEGRFVLEGEEFVTPSVVFEGEAELVEEPGGRQWMEVGRKMALRYRGEDGLRYLEKTANQGRWLIRLVPSQILSWEGGGWAKRYHDDPDTVD